MISQFSRKIITEILIYADSDPGTDQLDNTCSLQGVLSKLIRLCNFNMERGCINGLVKTGPICFEVVYHCAAIANIFACLLHESNMAELREHILF